MRGVILSFALCALPIALRAQALRDSATVKSDGADLFVEIRSVDSTKPVVLFLHGGPGDHISALLPFMAYPGPALERGFTMAYLYERGVGKSGPVPLSSQTLAQHVRDVDHVADYLRRRFRVQRIAIIGHSWGGLLGTRYVLDHSDKVSALVQVCGPFNLPRGDSDLYTTSLAWYRLQKDTASIAALEKLGPPPWHTLEDVITSRRYAKVGPAPGMPAMDMQRVLAAGGYSAADPKAMGNAMAIVGAMFKELSLVNLEPRLSTARTPMLLIAGGLDGIVLPKSLKPGYDAWGGLKEWSVFENSGHLPYVDSTDRFVTTVAAYLQNHLH
jgi:pimeloyl-ACP methyl ester carboxylesterase